MRLLAIDYGRAKVGLAVSVGRLAEPLSVIRYEKEADLVKRLKELVEKEKIERVVVGVSEGEMGEASKAFGLRLTEELDIPVETFDETLSSQDAQKLAISAGIKRSKRKALEDAFAAAVVLQLFIDSHV